MVDLRCMTIHVADAEALRIHCCGLAQGALIGFGRLAQTESPEQMRRSRSWT